MRSSSNIERIIWFLAVILATYVCMYGVVRVTHTKPWFDKSNEETGSYTLFDTWSKSDTWLYSAFYPMLVLDSVAMKRPFVRDKW
jgi:hypothetical protein